MCGRLNVIDDPAVIALCEVLGIDLWQGKRDEPLTVSQPLLCNRFTRVANKVSIIREVNGKRCLEQALWWLLLDQTEDGFKPSKWTSFNTRYDKLNATRSAGYEAYRHSRCIIPVKGFGETQGKGAKAVYTDFIAETGAIAMGGLCREWIHSVTGETILSCSVITLPAHEKLKSFHEKSTPLMLSQDDNTMDMWLDGTLTQVEVFNDLLKPHIPHDLVAQHVDKPSTYNSVGEVILIPADFTDLAS
jgi:putative SOS response-associated peptidase YedK